MHLMFVEVTTNTSPSTTPTSPASWTSRKVDLAVIGIRSVDPDENQPDPYPGGRKNVNVEFSKDFSILRKKQ